ncbi:MAG: renal dipeptidase [Gammaproteobacteria bacterium]|jgi:membrane dipeptidase|nr:renal dipeptidase [Gammaproteobacteria bacterium]
MLRFLPTGSQGTLESRVQRMSRRAWLGQGAAFALMLLGANRRSLVGQGAAFAAGTGTSTTKVATPKVASVYRRAIVIDTLSMEAPSFDPRAALDAGLTGVVLDLMGFPRTRETAIAELTKWNAAFAAPDCPFRCILEASDFREAKQLRKFAVVLNSQDAGILGIPSYSNSPTNIEALRMFHHQGLRILQLTYTNNNGLGTGYSDVYDAGLSRLGRAVVAEMNRLGMLIDTSHCSEKTTLEAIGLSSRPIAVTHAGCYSLYADLRNKSDKVIRALANKGGYMGIYNMTLWMTTRPTSSVETIVDHIDHAVKVGGMDLVGFGSDHPVMGDGLSQAQRIEQMSYFIRTNKGWPGGEAPRGHVTASDMDGADRLLVLAEALDRRGYSDAQIEKVLGGNFVRVFGAACG